MTMHFGLGDFRIVWIGRTPEMSARIQAATKGVSTSFASHKPSNAKISKATIDAFDIIFAEAASADDAATFAKLSAATSPKQRIIAVTPDTNVPYLRELVRLGISDWLTAGASDQDIVDACYAPKLAHGGSGARNIFAFTPVLGGMGATTLAIETALILSKSGKEPTCLVDLDFYSGECADFLNIDAKLAIDSLSKNADAIDEHLLESVLSDHTSGIKLLAAKTHLGANQTINQRSVIHLLNLVSNMFANVVIDLPRSWQPWTDEIIIGTDRLFLISDGSVPALRATKRQLEEFRRRYAGKVEPLVIINKIDRAWFSTSLSDKDFKQSLGENFAGSICDETKLAREAIDRGIPISSVRKNAALVKELQAIMLKNVR